MTESKTTPQWVTWTCIRGHQWGAPDDNSGGCQICCYERKLLNKDRHCTVGKWRMKDAA